MADIKENYLCDLEVEGLRERERETERERERELGMKQINIVTHKLNLYPADIRGSSVCVRLIQLCLFTMLITQAAQRLGG